MHFNPYNSVTATISRIFDIMAVTVLFAVFCVPVFTVGASLCAMHKAMMDIAEDKCSSVWQSFFDAFKGNFKIATLLWLTAAAVGAVIFLNINICWGYEGEKTLMMTLSRVLTVFLISFYSAMCAFAFGGTAKFFVSYGQALNNAFCWTAGKPGISLLLIAIDAVMAAAIFMLWYYAVPVIAAGLYFQNKLLLKAMIGRSGPERMNAASEEGTYYE